jgi:hypothetical protein
VQPIAHFKEVFVVGKVQRKRWADNERAIEITKKPKEEITPEDIEFLKESYTSMGGLLPKGFNGGAFFTPTHVAKFLVDFLDIPNKPAGTKILEPSVGSGIFLEHIPASHEITALELNITSANVTSIIYPHANVIVGDALEHDRENYYDFVIGNPPYGESVKTTREFSTLTKKKEVYSGKSEVAFLELAIRACKAGGYVAFVLPMGLSYASTAKKLRKLMYESCWHVATIELPTTTFQHVGTSIPTQILILRKVPEGTNMIPAHRSLPEGTKFFEGQQPSLFARVGDIGYDKKGNSTDKWGDGLTQLDELLELVGLGKHMIVRENLYPYEPWWVDKGEAVTEYFFSKSAGTRDEGFHGSEGFGQESRYLPNKEIETGLVYWHEMTLGVGEGRSWEFWWQDEIMRGGV